MPRRLLQPHVLVLTVVALVLLVLLAATLSGGPAGEGETVLLSINDVYRLEGVDRRQVGGLARVRTLRDELAEEYPQMVTLLAGDFLSPSLLSRKLQGEQMVDVLNLLDGGPGVHDPRFLVTFGNHEFDREIPAKALAARIGESEFSWLASDLDFAAGFPERRLREHGKLFDRKLIESGGLTLGFFSLTIGETKPTHVAFEDPRTVALSESAWLRARGADVVVALTHLTRKQDLSILALGARGPDLVLGGHDHVRMAVDHDGRWLVKADAEARTAAVVWIQKRRERSPTITVGFRKLDLPGDPEVERRVQAWLDCHARKTCPQGEPDCLEEAVGFAEVPLIAEENRIRRYETNLGNWVADQMRAAFPEADVAFVNSGLLRLNYDLPKGEIKERELRELVGFDGDSTRLVELKLKPSVLEALAKRSVEGWNGSGHFLQISGFAFEHVQVGDRRQVNEVRLIRSDEGEPVLVPLPKEEGAPLRAVTVAHLAAGNDGYEMLAKAQDEMRANGETVPVGEPLIKVLHDALTENGQPRKIAPALDGRICAAADRASVPFSKGAQDDCELWKKMDVEGTVPAYPAGGGSPPAPELTGTEG